MSMTDSFSTPQNGQLRGATAQIIDACAVQTYTTAGEDWCIRQCRTALTVSLLTVTRQLQRDVHFSQN